MSTSQTRNMPSISPTKKLSTSQTRNMPLISPTKKNYRNRIKLKPKKLQKPNKTKIKRSAKSDPAEIL